MQFEVMRPMAVIEKIQCDRCGRLAASGDQEFEEFISIDHHAGYESVFGDGSQLHLDICQHCVRDTLGAWIRIRRDKDGGSGLERFDRTRHGGEFPSPQDTAPGRETRLGRFTQAAYFIRYSARLYVAPLTGLLRAVAREYRLIERREQARQRNVRAASGRRG